MSLSIKQYRNIKLVSVFILAVIFSQAVIYKNFFIAVAFLLVFSLLLFFLRRRVSGVLADERDYALAGKSAILAIQVYSWLAVIAMFLLYSLADINPFYQSIAMTLAFSTTILMLLYSLVFNYHNKFKFSDKRLVYVFVVLVFFLLLAVFSLRLFSGEDSWVCQDGSWQKHGQPSYPAPEIECR
jgi:uncharacterized membrane protein